MGGDIEGFGIGITFRRPGEKRFRFSPARGSAGPETESYIPAGPYCDRAAEARMLCELCGNDVPRTKTVVVEATVLAVCPSCARFGTEVGAPAVRRKATPPVIAERLEARRRRMTPRDVYTQ